MIIENKWENLVGKDVNKITRLLYRRDLFWYKLNWNKRYGKWVYFIISLYLFSIEVFVLRKLNLF